MAVLRLLSAIRGRRCFLGEGVCWLPAVPLSCAPLPLPARFALGGFLRRWGAIRGRLPFTPGFMGEGFRAVFPVVVIRIVADLLMDPFLGVEIMVPFLP